MKIVQVVPRMDSGGVERGVVEVSRSLVQHGHKSIVISQGGRMVTELLQDGAVHVSMRVGTKSPASLPIVFALVKWLANENLDIVHPRSRLPAWLCKFAISRLKDYARPVFLTSVHGLYSVSKYSSIAVQGKLVETVSNTAKNYVLDNYPYVDPKKIRVIERGLDPSLYNRQFRPSHEWLADWRRRYNDTTAVNIVLPGRLARLKGHVHAFDLVIRLQDQGINARLFIVGSEEPGRAHYAHDLRSMAKRNPKLRSCVYFLGHRSDLREIMAVADFVLAFSEKPESFGRTVLEAVALGTPVIGFDHGGVGEILRSSYEYGAVPPFRTDVAASRIQGHINNPRPIRSPDLTLSEMCDRTLAMYSEAVQ